MATNNKLPIARKKPLAPKKQVEEVAKKVLADMNASHTNYFFSNYFISNAITEDCELYGAVKEKGQGEDHDYIRVQPFDFDDDGNKIWYEEVYINLKEVNSVSSAAGQFLSLFQKARHWGEVVDRVIGIKVKLTKGKPEQGKEPKVFKNVIKVFKTDLDDLVFDDSRAKYPKMTKQTSDGKSIRDVLDEPDDDVEDAEAIEEDDDTEAETPSQSKFSDEIFDEEDVDDEEWEEEE